MSELDSGDNAGALINRAVVAARQHQLAQAIDLFGQVLNSTSATPELIAKALYNRAVIYGAVNLPQKALSDFETALGLAELNEPERSQAYLSRAMALSKLGHHDTAVSALLAFLSQNSPQSPLYEKGQHSLRQARRERDANDKVLGRLSGQIKSRIISPQARAQAQFDRALAVSHRGDWAGALDDYDQLLAQPELPAALRAMTFCNRGVVRAAVGRVPEAVKDYQDAVAVPEGGAQAQGNALNNWGLVLLNSGQAQAAVNLFSQGLAIANLPDDVSHLLLSNRAVAFGHLGQLAERCADLDALLLRTDLSSARRDALCNQRGLLRLQLGDIQGAESDFLSVVSEPLRHADQAALAYNNLGVLAGQLQQQDQALGYFARAIETPNAGGGPLSNAYFNQGAALASKGKMQEALAAYAAAIGQLDADPAAVAMALNNRAMLLADMDNDSAAWVDIATVLAQKDLPLAQRAKAYATRARICYKRGQWQEVSEAAQAGLQGVDSLALKQMDGLAKVWMGDTHAARAVIEGLTQRPDAQAVLSQFRTELELALTQGLPVAHVQGLLELLPEPAPLA